MPTEPDSPGRPHASWVMGRSARWHDPVLQAEIAMEELGRGRSAVPVLGTAATLLGSSPNGPGAAFVAPLVIGRVLRLVHRAVRSLPRG